MVTFRLAGALPRQVLAELERELQSAPEQTAEAERRRKIEAWLDAEITEQWLAQPSVAHMVEKALLHFDGERYRLAAWVLMPNHAHVLLMPLPPNDLSRILHSWKSFTSHRANRTLGRSGAFWAPDYYDRLVRNDEHFAAAVSYIESNPVKAGLCADAAGWRWSSARRR